MQQQQVKEEQAQQRQYQACDRAQQAQARQQRLDQHNQLTNPETPTSCKVVPTLNVPATHTCTSSVVIPPANPGGSTNARGHNPPVGLVAHYPVLLGNYRGNCILPVLTIR